MTTLGMILAAFTGGMMGWVMGWASRNKEVAAWRAVERMQEPGACGQCGLDFDGSAVRHCVNGRLDCPVAVYAVDGVRALDPHEGALLRKVLQYMRDAEGITVDMIPLGGRTVGGAPTATFTAEDIVRLQVLEDLNFKAELALQGIAS